MQEITILDIETIAMPEEVIRAKLPPFNPDKVALGNLKDPDKVAAKIAEAQRTHGDDAVRDGALHATTGTLAIVGFRHGETVTQYHAGEMKETAMIEAAFAHILRDLDKGVVIAGYGVKFFDLPLIIGRAWNLGIRVPSRVFNAFRPKYPWSESLVCLQEVWLAGSATPFGTRVSLATVLRELGIPPKTGTGAMFGELWQADKVAALAYNAADLDREMQLARRIL